MELKKLIAQATPLPWKMDENTELPPAIISANDEDGVVVNENLMLRDGALIVHAVNMLPKLVEALKQARRLADDRFMNAAWWEQMTKVMDDVLAEANNLEVPQ